MHSNIGMWGKEVIDDGEMLLKGQGKIVFIEDSKFKYLCIIFKYLCKNKTLVKWVGNSWRFICGRERETESSMKVSLSIGVRWKRRSINHVILARILQLIKVISRESWARRNSHLINSLTLFQLVSLSLSCSLWRSEWNSSRRHENDSQRPKNWSELNPFWRKIRGNH